jgi:phage uncharacterized protein (putative large terminase), C-terminal domain
MNVIVPPCDLEVADALYRTSFFAFVWRCFDTLNPGHDQSFVPAWHVRAMCHQLDQVHAGHIERLAITVPPRHLKSVTVSVAFAAFVLGHNPAAKIIVASYGLDLARKHSEDCRRVMSSAWYRRAFPKTRLAERGNTLDEIRTTQGGGRKAVSVGSAVTGHGADYIIIDDLMKAGDAASEVELDRAADFIQSSLLSRFDNPSKGRVVAIAQRLHERDPVGFLLDTGAYTHLNLPAIAETDEGIPIGHGQFHHRKVGEALFPERVGLEVLARQRREMGSALFNCQYQQNPIAPDGSQLRWEWFGTYEHQEDRSAYQLIVQSWDTGMSADPRSDFSVCTTWGFKDRVWHLLDVIRERLDYPDLLRRVHKMDAVWRPDQILIEKAATGIPLLQHCRDTIGRRCVSIQPTQDKEIRFNAACARIEAGEVLLPRDARWLPDTKRELLSFPRGRYDDVVDSASQFLNWAGSHGFWHCLPYEHELRRERREARALRRR